MVFKHIIGCHHIYLKCFKLRILLVVLYINLIVLTTTTIYQYKKINLMIITIIKRGCASSCNIRITNQSYCIKGKLLCDEVGGVGNR